MNNSSKMHLSKLLYLQTLAIYCKYPETDLYTVYKRIYIMVQKLIIMMQEPDHQCECCFLVTLHDTVLLYI